MEKLLQPDTGLMFWTIATFLALVFIFRIRSFKEVIQRGQAERDAEEEEGAPATA